MFLSDDDYRVVIGEASLTVVTQADPTVREAAEQQAIEEISGYLRPRYDTAAIFAANGTSRNGHLVMITCDVALNNLFSSVNAKMGADARKERYERAIQWLEKVQKGTVVPDLPLAVDEQGNSATPVHYGSEKRHKNTW